MQFRILLNLLVITAALQVLHGCDLRPNTSGQANAVAAEIALIEKEILFYKRHTELLNEIVSSLKEIENQRPLTEVESGVLELSQERIRLFQSSIQSLETAHGVLKQ